MNPQSLNGGRQPRLRLLKRQNDYLRHQNDLLQEALDTICAAFLNNSRGLDTAIQVAMTLQQRVRQASEQIQRPDRDSIREID
jgi:aryl carrier-like protein